MDDTWPDGENKYRDHLYAIGVMAINFNTFERALFSVYSHHPSRQGMPYALAEPYYSALNESGRLSAIRKVFDLYEKDNAVKDFAYRLVDYFDWCSDARNKLLHSELHPALFSAPDMLHLTKRKSKNQADNIYISLRLEELRDIADKVIAGRSTCAEFIIWLKIRDIPMAQLPRSYKVFADDPLPSLLVIPEEIEVNDTPTV